MAKRDGGEDTEEEMSWETPSLSLEINIIVKCIK